MFNIFKKIKKKDYLFLKAICDSLFIKYPYLIEQVNDDFILDKEKNPISDNKKTFSLILNSEMESNFKNSFLPKLFIIKDIWIWNFSRKEFTAVELHIVDGILSGFTLDSKVSDLDLKNIDISKIKEKHFADDSYNLLSIVESIPEKLVSKLSINNSFKIEIPEGIFYTLKDLKNGNYISINEKGEIYKMIHDPYRIEKIFDDVEAFYEAFLINKFEISSYEKPS